MNNNNSKGVSYLTGFFMLIGISLLGFVVSGFIGVLFLTSPETGNIKDALTDPDNASKVRLIQTISLVFSMFLPTLFVAFVLNKKPFQLMGFRNDARLKQIMLVVLITFLSMFVAGLLGQLTKELPWSSDLKLKFEQLEKSYAEQVEVMLDFNSTGGYIISIVLMAFLPALCEETLFRGGLQNFLSRATNKPWLAIIVVSIIFSLIHFSVYGFLPRVFLGVILGYIYYLTRDIWLCITAHFFNNAIAVTHAYVLSKQGEKIKEALAKDIPGMYWGLLGIPILFLLFRVLKKSVPTHDTDHEVKSIDGI
ncbi:MAG: CPBP family glutamic-type intramembrane protease [Flavisolibacter sp.]